MALSSDDGSFIGSSWRGAASVTHELTAAVPGNELDTVSLMRSDK